MAHSANLTKLSYRVGSAAFEEIPHLIEVPELGGTPEKIDVTTLADKFKRYIPGIIEYADLVFKFFFDNENEDANFRLFRGLADNNTTATFKVEYPDGTAHQFDAIPSVKIEPATINGALTLNVTMLLQSDIEVINPTA